MIHIFKKYEMNTFILHPVVLGQKEMEIPNSIYFQYWAMDEIEKLDGCLEECSLVVGHQIYFIYIYKYI